MERSRLASGTSSRSTKLLHGGLRYLEHLGQWGLVRDALRERTLLLGLLRDLVRPLPILLPCTEGGRPPWMLRAGLWLYDRLAGASNLPRARRLDRDEVRLRAPYLAEDSDGVPNAAFLYHDAQMKDDCIVRLVAEASRRLGASYSEGTSAEGVESIPGGFRVELDGPSGGQTLTSRAVVNATGPWCTANLLRWGLTPRILTVLNVGSHLVFGPTLTAADPDRSAATLFQNRDGRVVFFLPWFGRWLLGTTESLLAGSPDALPVSPQDREYLLGAARELLGAGSRPKDHVVESFAGVRTMPVGKAGAWKGRGPRDAWRERPFDSPFYLREYPKSLSSASRETVVDESVPNLFSIYGGKYTTYRSQGERIGDLLSDRLGPWLSSGTREARNWFLEALLEESPSLLESDPRLRSM